MPHAVPGVKVPFPLPMMSPRLYPPHSWTLVLGTFHRARCSFHGKLSTERLRS